MTDYNLSITKQQIAELPTAEFTGEIFLADTPERAAMAVEELEKYDLIGFDTETKPSFKKGAPNKVALMQLATMDKCYLFRLNQLGMPDELCRLIENDQIAKIGLSVHDDFHVMHRSSEFKPKGFIELQDYVKNFKIADISLQKVFAIIFGQKISKSQRLTNWEAQALTPRQQVYAATDAWACLKIYDYLMSEQFHPDESIYKVYADEQAN